MHVIQCGTCLIHKTLEHFHRNKSKPHGCNTTCKACVSLVNKKWRESNPERAKAHVEYWHKGHPNQMSAIKKKWKLQNPEYMTADAAHRRAAKHRATPPWADQKKIAEFYDAAAFLSMVTGEWHNVDHIVPLIGPKAKTGEFTGERLVHGLHVETNLQILTADANRRKSNRHWPDMP